MIDFKNGSVFKLKPQPAEEFSAELVPAVLVYADLLVSGEPRQREHAERLRRLNDRLEFLDRS